MNFYSTPSLDFQDGISHPAAKPVTRLLGQGLEKVLDTEVAIFNAASGGFILQNYYQEDWAGNFMMQLMVDDLDTWWARIETLGLTKRFGVPPPKPPAMQPWGLRVAYVVDPSGVLWHISQRRKDAIQDQ